MSDRRDSKCIPGFVFVFNLSHLYDAVTDGLVDVLGKDLRFMER